MRKLAEHNISEWLSIHLSEPDAKAPEILDNGVPKLLTDELIGKLSDEDLLEVYVQMANLMDE